jgi:hypothetical protein
MALTIVTKAAAMSTRRDDRAMTRGASMARPGAAFILGGLLLLTVP